MIRRAIKYYFVYIAFIIEFKNIEIINFHQSCSLPFSRSVSGDRFVSFCWHSGQFTAPMLASILMIVGYSINDTIVVFDRIREELDLNPGTDLRSIINLAISRVFSRSLLTSITTLLAAVSLYVFGAGVINDFAFVFIVGILVGTFSSIFIASPVFYWWHKGDRRHVQERQFTPKRYEWESQKESS